MGHVGEFCDIIRSFKIYFVLSKYISLSRNIFRSLKIIFHSLEIIFRSLKIIFHSLKIIFRSLKIIFRSLEIYCG